MATSTSSQAQARVRNTTAEDVQATIRRRNTTRIVQRILVYALLVLIALIILVPLAWMISTSFKPKSQLFLPDIYWIPKRITGQNYQNLLTDPSVPIIMVSKTSSRPHQARLLQRLYQRETL